MCRFLVIALGLKVVLHRASGQNHTLLGGAEAMSQSTTLCVFDCWALLEIVGRESLSIN